MPKSSARGVSSTCQNNWWIGGPAVLNTYPSYSLKTFFFVNTQKIYLVSCPDSESGNKELTNTFRFDLSI